MAGIDRKTSKDSMGSGIVLMVSGKQGSPVKRLPGNEAKPALGAAVN